MISNSRVKLSVVIPLYNKRDRIVACIDSVLHQTCLPDEIIIVNDGSIDGSEKLVRQKFGNRVTLIDQANHGVSHARNTGIRIAKNEFICLLDADDEWESEFLLEIERLIQRFPQAQLFATGYLFNDSDHISIAKAGVQDDYFGELNFLEVYARASGIVSSSSVCIKKTNYTNGIVFPEHSGRGEDIYYWVRLALLGNFAFSGKRLTTINRDEEAGSFISRIDEIPYYIEWIVNDMPAIKDVKTGKHLRRILWSHSLKSSVLAVLNGKPEYLSELSCLLRTKFRLLSVSIYLLRFINPMLIRFVRRILVWLRCHLIIAWPTLNKYLK